MAYVLLTIILAVFIESFSPLVSRLDKGTFSQMIELLAISTIFPSMIMLKGEELHYSLKRIRQIIIAVTYAYIIMPLLSILLSHELMEPDIGAGYVLANVVPSSSAALGYVLITGGDIELATIVIVMFVILSPAIIPAYLTLISTVSSVQVSPAPVLWSLLFVLVMPLVFGQLIRQAIRRKYGEGLIQKELRPTLSAITMLSMLAMVYFLIARKSSLMVRLPWLAAVIIGAQALAVLALVSLSIPISRILRLSYREHQAIVFPAMTKNQGVAAAIAASSLGTNAALAPALIPAIQPVLAIAYIHMERFVMEILRR